MAAEKKTHKFQLMMTPAEVEAIDDWRFAKRINSRAEAIRQLTATGLRSQDLLHAMECVIAYLEAAGVEVGEIPGRCPLMTDALRSLVAR